MKLTPLLPLCLLIAACVDDSSVVSGSDHPAEVIDDFKSWRTDGSQELRFDSDKISATFSQRIDYSLKDFNFINDRRGYAVGLGAVVGQYPIFYSTDDAGQSWTRKPLRIGQNPTGIAFRNAQEGIITTHDTTGCPPPSCLNKTVTLNTQDGGESWELIEHKELRGSINNPISDSLGNYYAAVVLLKYDLTLTSHTRSVQLVKSEDAGRTWDVIYEAGSDAYNAHSFQLVGETIFVPTDDFTITKLDLSGKPVGAIETTDGRIQDFIAVSEEVVFALIVLDDTTGYLVRTVDAGQSWDVIRTDWPWLVAARSPDAIVVMLYKGRQPGPIDSAGGVSALAYTEDGGLTWAESEMVQSFYSTIRWNSMSSNRDLILLDDRVVTVVTSPDTR